MANQSIARLAVALIWIYQGLVPKLLAHHADELNLARLSGVPESQLHNFVTTAGVLELLFGILILAVPKWRWPMHLSMFAMVGAAISVTLTAPAYTVAAFNPISLNIAVFFLALLAVRPENTAALDQVDSHHLKTQKAGQDANP